MFILVGGYGPDDAGPYELTVWEVAAGRYCQVTGTHGGSCDDRATTCPASDCCLIPAGVTRGTCATALPVDAVCDATSIPCVRVATCVPDAPEALTGHCRTDGSRGGYCRGVGMPPCDPGLTCYNAICR